jgi:putative ABC transport system permease protein
MLIICESLSIALAGGLIGFGLTKIIIPLMEKGMSDFLPTIPLTSLTIFLAAVATLLVGLLAAVLPVAKALRTKIVDGLRIVE